MGNPKLTAGLIDGLDYRSFAQQSPGPRERDLYLQELTDYLFRFYLLFLVIVAAILYWQPWKNHFYTNISSSTWPRSRPSSSRTHVEATGSQVRDQGWLAHCIAGLFMAYNVNNPSAVNPLAPPWWPDVSGSATRTSGAVEPTHHRLFKPFSRRSQVAQDLNQYTWTAHSLIPRRHSLSMHFNEQISMDPFGTDAQPLSAAIYIHEEQAYPETRFRTHKVQRDTMIARFRACGVCFKQLQCWLIPDGKRPSWAAWLTSFLGKKLEFDYIFSQDNGVSYHLGFDVANGHYCIAIQDGGTWRVYDDAMDTVEFSSLPWVAQEETVYNTIHDPKVHDNWNDKGCLGWIFLILTSWWTPSTRATDLWESHQVRQLALKVTQSAGKPKDPSRSSEL